MIIFIFRNNFFSCSLLHGLGQGHDKDDRIRVTEGLVLPAPQSTMQKGHFYQKYRDLDPKELKLNNEP